MPSSRKKTPLQDNIAEINMMYFVRPESTHSDKAMQQYGRDDVLVAMVVVAVVVVKIVVGPSSLFHLLLIMIIISINRHHQSYYWEPARRRSIFGAGRVNT